MSGKKKKNKVFKFNQKYKKNKNIKRAATWPINLLNMKKNEYQTINQQPKRKINKEPYKVLDAPNLIDDYYLNLLDWS